MGSPFSWRVEIALKMKGVKYEYSEEDIHHSKSPALLKYNPVHKKIPVLVHNGKPISANLQTRLMETFCQLQNTSRRFLQHNPILPRDPYKRAMARFWAKFLDEKHRGRKGKETHEEARQLLSTLEGELKGKKFFGGETVGFIDIMANFVGYWVGVIQEAVGADVLTEGEFPLLCKWAEEFQNCPVIKEKLPPKDKLLAFFEVQAEMITSFYKNKA
ncbi:hypothetical protein ACJRO7_008632 [Eucalyptus globulus]|uniref:glutathione transferase n=1 Tax=Eucalyptus globulus TaxID=34317 RepID=A0ABD3ISJ3_EUCGL